MWEENSERLEQHKAWVGKASGQCRRRSRYAASHYQAKALARPLKREREKRVESG